MKLISLTPDLAKEWDRIVYNSDDAWIFHLYGWLPLTEANWNLESKSFLAEYEGKIVGIFPLQLNRRSKSLKSTYMGLGGPALMNGLHDGVRNKIIKAMHEHVYLIASQNQSPYIEIFLNPLSKASLNNRWQINPLIHYLYEDVSTHTWIIDLKLTEEEIVNNYSEVTRKKIRRANKEGYIIEPVTALSDVDHLYEVHCENRKKTGAEIHPKNFFYGFYKEYCEKGLALMLQAKDPQGDLVAFRATGLFKECAMSWMGSCKTRHLDSGVNYLLHHHSLIWAKQHSLRWFESGEAFPNAQEGKMHGLTAFKEKFGGELHRLYKGRIMMNGPSRMKSAIEGLTKFSNFLRGAVRRARTI